MTIFFCTQIIQFWMVDEQEFLKNIGLKIVELRIQQQMSQSELASKCQFDKSNLRRIEAGRTNPTALTLKKIAEALNVPIDWLIKGTNINH